jgi:hypothetical protein
MQPISTVCGYVVAILNMGFDEPALSMRKVAVQDEDAPVVLDPEFGVPEPRIFSVVTDVGCV